MSAAKRSRIEELFVKDDPNELVYFSIRNKPLVKIHKSVLIENSSVFKDMFADGVTNDEPLEPIVLTDKTTLYRTYDSFILFARCLYEKESVASLIRSDGRYRPDEPPNQCALPFGGVFHFADKYHVQWLIDACKEVARKGLSDTIMDCFMVGELPKCVLALIQKMGLEEPLMSIFRKVKLSMDPSKVVEQFKMCQEMDVEELTNQVVDFCCNMKFDPSWPMELTGLVMDRLKVHVAKSKLKGVLCTYQLEQLPK